MAVTTLPRFGLIQWGAGSDTPNRQAFNAALKALDDNAAKDSGAVGGTALPSTGLVDGMYAQTVDGPYRRFYRRAGGAWQQQGGNTWSETIYLRGATSSATGGLSRETGHADLTSYGAREYFDGSSIRGARQAIGDLNTGQPGALHVGDTTSAVDLTTRGRVYALTAGTGGRGYVAAAHSDTAGPLFAAREQGGTEPWSVDSRGRMRAQAPASFGAADLASGAPIASAPGAGHVTAADLAAAANKAALRILRALGDSSPIAAFEQDKITLGRASWAGARVDLIAPTVAVTGAFSVTGAAGFGTINAGQTTVTSLRSTGALQAASVVADSGLTAEGGRIYSQTFGSGATLLSRPPVQYSGSSPASVRQPSVTQSSRNPELPINSVPDSVYDIPVALAEDGWLKLDSVLGLRIDTGASNSLEMGKVQYWFDLRNSSGLIETSYAHTASVISDDTSRQIQGHTDFASTDVFWTRLSAGNYTIRLRIRRTTVLGGYVAHLRYTITPVVLVSVDT